jgi:hypothetical protein
MQLALDIGTINIQNQEIARFIQNKSIEEIKSLFIDFLKKEFIQTETKEKSKWGEFATKMRGSFTPEMVEHLKKAREEARDNFRPRIIE